MAQAFGAVKNAATRQKRERPNILMAKPSNEAAQATAFL